MPRLFYRRKSPLSTEERLKRAKRYRSYRSDVWIDPYPHILGTKPEKMVYAYLMQIGIGFYFQTWFQAKLTEFKFDKWYRPDFMIPSLKIIIEVQGFYWHSQPDQIEKDAFKYAIYETLGYKVLTWWDYEIEQGVHLLFQQDPRLAYYSGKFVGEVITKNKSYTDDSAGVSTANRKRGNKSSAIIRTGRKPRGILTSYEP